MIEHAPFLSQDREDVRAGLLASAASIVWTAITSTLAIGLGIKAGSVVLIAFGAVGCFDLAGSTALVIHFRHAVRHESFSARHEHLAHLVVSYGLLTVSVASLIASTVRLAQGAHASGSTGGLLTAAASVVVLTGLGISKWRIGRRIPSQALVTDGWLSLTGSATAACTLAGLAMTKAFGWDWVDPVAAMIIGATAFALAIVSLRSAPSSK